MRKEIKTIDDFLSVLEDTRKEQDITKHKLSVTSGHTHATYWNWVRMGIMPKLDTALKYAAALGLKVFIEK